MWREIWEKKGKSTSSKRTLKELISQNGFDSKTGFMDEKAWMKTVSIVNKKLLLSPDKCLLEVGCGCGAILLPLTRFVKEVAGVDYSKSLIKTANEVLHDKGIVSVSEGKRLPFRNGTFDCILSHSVFFYFPDYDYADQVLREMERVSKSSARILIMDIPDASKKEECEKYRIESVGGEKKYKEMYQGLLHLYYDKEWFKEFADKTSMQIEIFDQTIKNYGNSPFRFNVLLVKN